MKVKFHWCLATLLTWPCTTVAQSAEDWKQAMGLGFLRTIYPDFFDFSNVRGHIFEGIDSSHPAFANQPPIAVGDDKVSVHGQQVYGIVFGKHGILEDGEGYYTNYQRDYYGHSIGPRWALNRDLVLTQGIDFQVSAWGHDYTANYNDRSKELDRIVASMSMTVIQSVGNSSSELLRPEALASNVIGVGCVFHYGNERNSDDRPCNIAGRLPATYGVVKPDLVSYGDGITTTFLFGRYKKFGGTSSATAIVGGTAGVAIGLAKNGFFRSVPPTVRVIPELVKALLINTADQYDFQSEMDVFSRPSQGWGIPSIKNIVAARDSVILFPDKGLPNYKTSIYLDATVELKITSVCLAKPSQSSAADLIVTSPGGDMFLGNYGLFQSPYSLPEGTHDLRNATENVFLLDASAGFWSIHLKNPKAQNCAIIASRSSKPRIRIPF
jgi:hypothetical protein